RRADDKLREIYRNKRAERIDILDNDARAAELTQEQQNSACASCSHANIDTEKPERELKNQSENLKFECLSGTNKEMVFACTKLQMNK
ncbi:hypothetical protein J8A84_24575, partial [Vibrio parahaemolyticus]|nr:hypothetical protein [Vibrio parahaemolyticus]